MIPMSADKLRSVNTKFWDDAFVEDLGPEHRLLFLYLLTNPHCNIAGIYEITLRKIVYHTRLSEKQVADGLKTLEENRKAFFFEDLNFVFLPNFLKNQRLNPNMLKGVVTTVTNLPDPVKERIFGSSDKDISDPYRWVQDAIKYLVPQKKEKPPAPPKTSEEAKAKPDKDHEPAKENPKQQSLHTTMKELFLQFYSETKKTNYYWAAKDGAALKQLIGKISFSIKGSGGEPSDEAVKDAMMALLHKNNDPWVTENLSMTNLNSKYNEIVAKIKSGRAKGDRIGEDYRRTVLERLISGQGA